MASAPPTWAPPEYDTRPEVKLRYDLMYMCDWSVWLDLRLMLRAVSSSLAGTGR